MNITGTLKKMPIKMIAVLIVLALAGGLAYYLLHNNKVTALHATGVVDGPEVNLSSKVAGKVSWMCCREGDTVKAGQRAITLESLDLQASVDQAAAGVERANADIAAAGASAEAARANISGAEADMKSASANMDKARAQMEESKRESERADKLLSSGFISQESRDQSVTAYKADTASYDSAKEQLNSAASRKNASESQLKAALGQLNSSRAALREAGANLAFNRSKLGDTIINAPIDGVVIFKSVEAGETVSPGVTMMTLVDLGGLYARVDIDESRIAEIKLHAPAVITVDGLPGRTFSGRVSEIGRYAEFATQRDVLRGREDIKTFRVKVRLDDSGGILKPGMTVDVAFPAGH